MATIIQLRRDSSANWTSVDPILAEGEIGIETDTLRLKIGNGVDVWTDLPYYTTAGGVTSVAMSVPTGLEVSGSPITSSGTLAVTLATGYSIPTTAKQADWDSAFGWGNHATAGYLTSVSWSIITGKPSIPEKVSDLVNDSGFISNESDPVFSGSAAATITATDISNWNSAFGWGDHASAGYLDSSDIGVSVLAYDSGLASFLLSFTLPTVDGTVGQALVTDGSGSLSFTDFPSGLPAIGSEGQVLAVVSGEPEWANNPAGFANPMTTAGDLIVGDTGGVATRLPAGSNGDVLTIVSGVPTWVAGGGGSPSGVPAGVILEFGGTNAPEGYLLCDGSNVSRTTYADLFAVIGTNFGNGDGSTTFSLPDSRRRVSVGAGGTGTSTLGNTVGDTGGAETHTLTQAEMPNHTHIQNAHNHSQNNGTNVIRVGGSKAPSTASTGGHTTTSTLSNAPATATNQSTGGGGAHNNMQPSLVVTKIIKY